MTDIADKVLEFLMKEFYQNMTDVAIFKNDDGSYELFNKYYISKTTNGYKVSLKYFSQQKIFASLKNAVTWCIFENGNKYSQAKRIEFLDQMIEGMEMNMEVHKRLIKKTKDADSRIIYVSKLVEDQAKKKKMVKELASYVTEAKTAQAKKFVANDK